MRTQKKGEGIVNMELFIGNLPEDTSTVDLRRLLGKAGQAARYRIYRKKLLDGSIKCYGHAIVEPDQAALGMIHLLNHLEWRNHNLEVRPYFSRSHVNDRRAPLWSGRPWMGIDRRKRDRRGSG